VSPGRKAGAVGDRRGDWQSAGPGFLLDVNALIALLDPMHAQHGRAHEWFAGNVAAWASCPLTQSAFPGRSGRFAVRHAPLCNEGRSGQWLMLNDVGRVLREEERQARQHRQGMFKFFPVTMLGGHREYQKFSTGDGRACPGACGMILVDMLRREYKLGEPRK